jgi:hypothetical protein
VSLSCCRHIRCPPARRRERSVDAVVRICIDARTHATTHTGTNRCTLTAQHVPYIVYRTRPTCSITCVGTVGAWSNSDESCATYSCGRTYLPTPPTPTACASLASRARCRPTRPNRETLLSAPQRRQVLPGLDVQPSIRPAELLKPQATPVVRRSLPLGVSAGFKRQVLAMGAWQYVSCHARQR